MASNDEKDGEEDEDEEDEEEEEEEDAASGCSMVDQAVNLRSGLRVFVFPTGDPVWAGLGRDDGQDRI